MIPPSATTIHRLTNVRAHRKHIGMIVGGTGITPMLQVILITIPEEKKMNPRTVLL